MARPPARELTERELEVMHVFWNRGESTVADVRDALAAEGLDRAYTTIATLVRILTDKKFLIQTNDERPFSYRPARSYEDVSRKLLGELIDRVFRGSREQLLVRLMEQKTLTAKERALLEDALRATGETTVNTLGLVLLGSIAHATVFAVAGIAAYLGLRRWGPAAGSLAAGSSLAVMVLVSIVVLGPWPRWWTLSIDRTAQRPADPPPAATPADRSGGASRNCADQPPEAAPALEDRANRPTPPTVLALVLDELRRPTAAQRLDGLGLAGMARRGVPGQRRAGTGPVGRSACGGSRGCGRGAGRSRIPSWTTCSSSSAPS